MRNRKKLEEEIEKTKNKLVELQARLKELEKQKVEAENMEILQAVRSVIASPEEIEEILKQVKGIKELKAEKEETTLEK